MTLVTFFVYCKLRLCLVLWVSAPCQSPSSSSLHPPSSLPPLHMLHPWAFTCKSIQCSLSLLIYLLTFSAFVYSSKCARYAAFWSVKRLIAYMFLLLRSSDHKLPKETTTWTTPTCVRFAGEYYFVSTRTVLLREPMLVHCVALCQHTWTSWVRITCICVSSVLLRNLC